MKGRKAAQWERTRRRRKLLGLVAKHNGDNGFLPPTLRWLAERLEVSTSTVWSDIQALRRQGLVRSTPGLARTIVLTDKGKELLRKDQEYTCTQ